MSKYMINIPQQLWLRLAAVLCLLAVIFLIKFPGLARMYFYEGFRDLSRLGVMARTFRWPFVENEHFVVKYKPGSGNEKYARIVLEIAEKFYRPIVSDFGYVPKKKVLIIMHPSCEDLNRVFGWSAHESAMGVYWAGIIRVVSPKALIGVDDPRLAGEIYRDSGPLAHELTHLFIDYLTDGNYPRWFTEGVAQYEEYKLTGFLLQDAGDFLEQPFYSFKEMMNFETLSNQPLAYRESFEAIRCLVEVYGKNTLNDIIKELAEGKNIDEAFVNGINMNTGDFERKWKKWLMEDVHERKKLKKEKYGVIQEEYGC